MKIKTILILLIFIIVVVGSTVLIFPKISYANPSCPICIEDGRVVEKQTCLDGTCQTSCFNNGGIKCEAGEGHCANGACDPGCCGYQEITPGQACTDDSFAAGNDTGAPTTVICLDPGHVKGTAMDNSQNGIWESVLVFNVSKKVKKILEKDGYKVVMTRESEDAKKTPDGRSLVTTGSGGCGDPQSMYNRTDYCKAEGANIIISVHSDTSGNGPYLIIPPKPASGCTPNTTKEYFNQNLKYAQKIQSTMISALAGKHSGSKSNIVVEGSPYLNCNKREPNCWQLAGTKQAIKHDINKILIELTPDPEWYNDNIDVVSQAFASGISSSIPKNLGGGSCAQMGQRVVEAARSQMKKTYVWGGCHVEPSKFPKGCSNYDCTGLTGWSWWKGSNGKINFHGATITGGQYAGSNATYVKPGKDVAEGAQPGDIIGWSSTSSWKQSYHGAIYAGNNKLIEAYSSGSPSRETTINGRRPLYFLRPKACK